MLEHNRAVPSLKQAGREWHKLVVKIMLGFGFVQSKLEPCLFTRGEGKNMLILAVYVDDFFLAFGADTLRDDFHKHMASTFKVKDLGEIGWTLGWRVTRDLGAGTTTIDQAQYIDTILDEFGMAECHPEKSPEQKGLYLLLAHRPQTPEERKSMESVPYRSCVGKLLYLVCSTRPDIAQAVRQLSAHVSDPGPTHWTAAKRVLRYLKGTRDMGITYRQDANREVFLYSDSDHGSSCDDRKSITGMISILAGGPFRGVA